MADTKMEKTNKSNTPITYDYGENTGWEGTDASQLAIPFLNILQAGSPEVEADDPEGAKAGALYNTVTQELIDGKTGIGFLPCHKEGPFYVEWIPRDSGGGFVGIHQVTSETVQNSSPVMDPNSGKPTFKKRHGENDLVETFCVYGQTLNEAGDGAEGFAAISFTSTKIKPYRNWLTSMFLLPGPPPLFANRARITTKLEKRAVGNSYNFQIRPFDTTWAQSLIDPKTGKDLLDGAIAFREQVVTGMAKASFETEQGDVAESKSATSDPETDDIPF